MVVVELLLAATAESAPSVGRGTVVLLMGVLQVGTLLVSVVLDAHSRLGAEPAATRWKKKRDWLLIVVGPGEVRAVADLPLGFGEHSWWFDFSDVLLGDDDGGDARAVSDPRLSLCEHRLRLGFGDWLGFRQADLWLIDFGGDVAAGAPLRSDLVSIKVDSFVGHGW